MIGLSFLAVGLIWLALSWYLATRLPKWLSIKRPLVQLSLSALLLSLFLVGPFTDHIVGMRQFQKLCDTQTGLQVYPNALNSRKAVDKSTREEPLKGYLIPISQRTDSLVNAETGEVILRHHHFSTSGGWIGGFLRMGSPYECAVFQSSHPDHGRYRALRKNYQIIYGG